MSSWVAKTVCAGLVGLALMACGNDSAVVKAREDATHTIGALPWLEASEYTERLQAAKSPQEIESIVADAMAANSSREMEYRDCMEPAAKLTQGVSRSRWVTVTPAPDGSRDRVVMLTLSADGSARLEDTSVTPPEGAVGSDAGWIDTRVGNVTGWDGRDLMRALAGKELRASHSELLSPGVSCSTVFTIILAASDGATTYQAKLTLSETGLPDVLRLADSEVGDVAVFSRFEEI